ncbi:MAG: GNAT family N-acetyltransferase [Pseudobacteriovorax sp.]|nr:GNAT family N-acetyltransferase [Pseudobacteriovorax sp.]
MLTVNPIKHENLAKQAVSLPHVPVTKWQAKFPIEFQQSSYTIKTADSLDEFHEVLALRKEVFLDEFAGGSPLESDFDDYDLDADFLIIKQKGEIVASYRLISSRVSTKFYSSSEFYSDGFFSSSASKVELSRACVRKGQRASIALHLLWRGLVQYLQATDAQYLFGCSSIQTLDIEKVVNAYRQLKEKDALSNEISVSPRPDYCLLDVHSLAENDRLKPKTDEDLIPPLLQGYLRAGAKVYGTPAFDLSFGCIDFFTALDLNHLAPDFHKKYIVQQFQ